MGVHVERVDRGTRLRLAQQVQHAIGGQVEGGFVESSVMDGSDQLGVGASTTGRHFEVEAGGQADHPVVHRTPVADHQALEAPLAAQHVGEQPGVL